MRSPSSQQDQALRAVAKWFAESGPQVFYLGGYAGTGKTTLAKHFASSISDVLFCAYTGKASLVMQRKSCIGARTIHSLIYQSSTIGVCGGLRSTPIPSSEMRSSSSSTSARWWAKSWRATSYPSGPRCWCSAIRRSCPRLMVLATSHRNRRISYSPRSTCRRPRIPSSACRWTYARGKKLKLGAYGSSKVITGRQLDWADALAADEVLVGLNRTRKTCNERVRALRGLPPQVSPTDKLICLKNNHGRGLLNGGLWRVESVSQREPLIRMVTAITRAAERITVVLPSDLPPPGSAGIGGPR